MELVLFSISLFWFKSKSYKAIFISFYSNIVRAALGALKSKSKPYTRLRGTASLYQSMFPLVNQIGRLLYILETIHKVYGLTAKTGLYNATLKRPGGSFKPLSWFNFYQNPCPQEATITPFHFSLS